MFPNIVDSLYYSCVSEYRDRLFQETSVLAQGVDTFDCIVNIAVCTMSN